jgi:hypothetical protein
MLDKVSKLNISSEEEDDEKDILRMSLPRKQTEVPHLYPENMNQDSCPIIIDCEV